MDDRGDEQAIERIMDKAAEADRRALFAALQAAIGGITDMQFRRTDQAGALRRIETALDVGAPYGSPEQIASLPITASR